MTVLPLTGRQRTIYSNLQNGDNTVVVLDRSVNGCFMLVIKPNEPDMLRRVFVTAAGGIISDVKFRRVANPVAAVA